MNIKRAQLKEEVSVNCGIFIRSVRVYLAYLVGYFQKHYGKALKYINDE